MIVLPCVILPFVILPFVILPFVLESKICSLYIERVQSTWGFLNPVTFQAKMVMPDSRRYPLKLCLIKYELDINIYNSEKLSFSIILSLQKRLVHFYIRTKCRYFQTLTLYMNLYWTYKTTICLLHYITQIKVSMVVLWIGHCHLCAEGNMKLRLHFNNSCVTQSFQWPNLKNLSGGLNLSRGLNMVGST